MQPCALNNPGLAWLRAFMLLAFCGGAQASVSTTLERVL